MRKLPTVIMIVILLVLSVNVLYSGSSSKNAGYHFLRTYSGARPSAMAGAFISISGDIHSIYFNPAGLATIDKPIASVTYLNHLLDFQSGFVAYSRPLKSVGTLAVAMNYMNYGEFSETDINGDEVGTFSAGSYYLTTSLARKINKDISVGGSAKIIYSTIDSYSSSAIAADFGVIYHVPFIPDLDLGAGIFNLGAVMSTFIDEKDPLPLNFALGFSKKLAHLPFRYSVTASKYIDDDIQVNIGGEFMPSEGVFIRLGYNSLGRNQTLGATGDQFAGVSLGLGMNWRQYQFDYALSSYGAIGYLNRISFSYIF